MVSVYADSGLLRTNDVAAMLALSEQSHALNRDDLSVAFTHLTLLHFLGQGTCNELFGRSRSKKRFASARQFIRMDKSSDTTNAQLVRMSRCYWLAEALFNLQFCEGVNRVIADIRTGNLQAAWEELQCGVYIFQSQIRPTFLPTNAIMGKRSPDIAIELAGRAMFCEVEGKSEDTIPSPKTVHHTLDHARKQLPTEHPGIIYLRVPEHWKGQVYLDAALQPIRKFFSRTNRVVALLLRSERQIEDCGALASRALTLLIRNPYSNRTDEFVKTVLRLLDQPVQTWMTFDFLVDRVCEQLNALGRREA